MSITASLQRIKMKANNLKEKIIGKIIEIEGGYSNNSKDRGGRTKYGITSKTAYANGYIGDIKHLPYSKAYKIYSKKYWDINMLDDIAYLSIAIAEEVADTGVNMGPSTAGKFLQRSLNVLNRGGELFDDVHVDGKIGLRTVSALRDFLKIRGEDGEKVLLRMLNALQTNRYILIAEEDESQEEYLYGWVLNRG